MAVIIERTDSEIVIKLPLNIDPIEIQNILENFKFVDIVSRSKATQEDINKISNEVKAGWSHNMKSKLAKMDEFKDLFE